MWWLAPLIFSATGVAKQLLNKPNNHLPDTGYMDRYINNMKSDVAKKEYYHTAMRSNLKAIGTNAAQMRSRNEIDNAKYGLEGSGIASQKDQNVFNATNQAMSDASEKAMGVQANADRSMKSSIDQAMMLKDKMLTEARERNKIANEQWNKNWAGVALDSATNFATAGITNMEQWKKAGELAKAGGFVGDIKKLGSTPEIALKVATGAVSKGQTANFLKTAASVPTNAVTSYDDIVTQFKNNKITEAQAISLIKQANSSTVKTEKTNQDQKYYDLMTDTTTTLENVNQALGNHLITPSQALKINNFINKRDKPQYTQVTYFDDTNGNKIVTNEPSEQWDGAKSVTIPKGTDPKVFQENLQTALANIELANNFSYGDKTALPEIKEIIKDGNITPDEKDNLRGKVIQYVNGINEKNLQAVKSQFPDMNFIIPSGKIQIADIARIRKSVFDSMWKWIRPLIGEDDRDPNQLLDEVVNEN